jgi:hypothetical protein
MVRIFIIQCFWFEVALNKRVPRIAVCRKRLNFSRHFRRRPCAVTTCIQNSEPFVAFFTCAVEYYGWPFASFADKYIFVLQRHWLGRRPWLGRRQALESLARLDSSPRFASAVRAAPPRAAGGALASMPAAASVTVVARLPADPADSGRKLT